MLVDLQLAGEAMAKEPVQNARSVGDRDVSNEDSAKAAIDAAVSGLVDLNGLVNCCRYRAGREGDRRGQRRHRLATFQRVITANLVGSFNTDPPCCGCDEPCRTERGW